MASELLKSLSYFLVIITLLPLSFSQEPTPLPSIPRLPRNLFPTQLQECLSSLSQAPGCIEEINGSIRGGDVTILGSSCCKAIGKVNNDCWSVLFPLGPSFPPLLKGICANSQRVKEIIERIKKSNGGMLPRLPVSFPLPGDDKCWTPLEDVEGCMVEILTSLSSGKFSGIGNDCCKAIGDISDNCLTQMFPINPSFPPLLKGFCSHQFSTIAAPPPRRTV